MKILQNLVSPHSISSQRNKLIFIAVLAASPLLHAVPVPDAGTVTRETVPALRAETSPKNDAAILPDASKPEVASTDQTPIFVSSVSITGNKIYPEAELQALIADLPNKTHTLADLQRATAKISDYYHQHGYFLATAYLPQQQMDGGKLTIGVFEGNLGAVQLENRSKVRDHTAIAFLNALPIGQALKKEQAERVIFLLGDLPGVGATNARLTQGTRLGETALIVGLDPAKVWSGSANLDNGGSVYTGRYRLNGSLNANNLLGYGERMWAQLLGSDDHLRYGALNAELPVGGSGLKLGVGANRTAYALGERYAALDAVGTANTVNINASYPIIRSSQLNVNVCSTLESRRLEDDIRATQTDSRKDAVVGRITLAMSQRDGFGFGAVGGGINQAQVTISHGSLNIKTPSVLGIDDVSAKSNGEFEKYEVQLSRQQVLTQRLSALLQLQAQWASKNLDSSEKFSLSTIRAYPTGEAQGDEGWSSTAELRYALSPSLSTSLFYDLGDIRTNVNRYMADKNQRYLSGIGIGLTGSYKAFDFGSSLAWHTTQAAISESDKKPRLALQAGWHF